MDIDEHHFVKKLQQPQINVWHFAKCMLHFASVEITLIFSFISL
jgi:hypothetical protein